MHDATGICQAGLRVAGIRSVWSSCELFRTIRAIPIVSSDSEIILRSIDDPAMFGMLFDRHAEIIHRYVARRVGQDAANDVMSETFLVAFRRREAYDMDRPDARPWLFRIATVLLKQYRRIEAREWQAFNSLGAVAAADVAGIEDFVGSRVDARIALAGIGTTLAQMASRDRDVLLLYAWEDLTYEEIGVALNIPIGTVRSRLNRARRKLRIALTPLQEPNLEVDHGRTRPVA